VVQGYRRGLLCTPESAAAALVAGTTFANVVERGDYDPAQHACLSTTALEEILVLFCVDYYPQRFNRHLGGRPIDLWRNDPIVRDGLVPYRPSADDLRVLMGWTEERTSRAAACRSSTSCIQATICEHCAARPSSSSSTRGTSVRSGSAIRAKATGASSPCRRTILATRLG
jgi:hypothetical protein